MNNIAVEINTLSRNSKRSFDELEEKEQPAKPSKQAKLSIIRFPRRILHILAERLVRLYCDGNELYQMCQDPILISIYKQMYGTGYDQAMIYDCGQRGRWRNILRGVTAAPRVIQVCSEPKYENNNRARLLLLNSKARQNLIF